MSSSNEKQWKQLFAKYYSEDYRKIITYLLAHGEFNHYNEIEGSNQRIITKGKEMLNAKLIVYNEQGRKILNTKNPGIKALIDHIKENPNIMPEHIKKARKIKLKKGTLLDINIKAEKLISDIDK